MIITGAWPVELGRHAQTAAASRSPGGRDVHAVHSPSLEQWLADWDICGGSPLPAAVELFHAAPGGVRTTAPLSTANRWSSLDTDAAGGDPTR